MDKGDILRNKPLAEEAEMKMETTKDFYELSYYTWGSYGQYHRRIAVLVDGTVIDPKNMLKYSRSGDVIRKTITVNNEQYTVEVADLSSRKNARIEVRVPKEIVEAVISDSASSSGWRGFSVVEGDGKVWAEDVEKVSEKDRHRYTSLVRRYYYVNKEKGMKIPIEERTIETRRELVGKPVVHIELEEDRVIVVGDTYHIKERLKELGYKWDPLRKAWYKVTDDKESTASELQRKLDEAGVETSIQQ